MHTLRAGLMLSLMMMAAPALSDTGGATPLKAAGGSKAENHVSAGIEHYGMGHWDVAKNHFLEAEKADPKSAEAHYNLALVLDKGGDHAGATSHFKRALELGKGKPEIENSDILKKHVKM